MFIPSRLLYGLVPSAILDTHRFWQVQNDFLLLFELFFICYFFGALPARSSPPKGAVFFRVNGQPRERLCSLPVSVLFRMGSAEKTNQEVRDGNPTRLAGPRVQRLRPLGRGGHSLSSVNI